MARKATEAMKAMSEAQDQVRSEAYVQAEAARAARLAEAGRKFMQANGLTSPEACRAFVKTTMRGTLFMAPDPVEHWKRVLANPNAGFRGHELATEALQKLEARARVPEQDADEGVSA